MKTQIYVLFVKETFWPMSQIHKNLYVSRSVDVFFESVWWLIFTEIKKTNYICELVEDFTPERLQDMKPMGFLLKGIQYVDLWKR